MNFLFQARLHDDSAGQTLKQEFQNTRPIIVPIFDGVKALSPSIREWLTSNFPTILDDLDDGPSGPGKVDVRAYATKWWYYSDDVMPEEDDDEARASNERSSSGGGAPRGHRRSRGSNERAPANSKNSSFASRTNLPDDSDAAILSSLSGPTGHRMLNLDGSAKISFRNSFKSFNESSFMSMNMHQENMMYFHLLPIVKRSNHRKHNSHQWFFDSICQALDTKVSFAFLTDCGTTYNTTCLARLFYELYFKTDLIGVTARQRVETPNLYFHPCESSPFSCFRGDHTASNDARPCWKCYATYFFSPCPLQGFEFEATLIMNSAMFNLVEALPVMPGPCQLLNWQRMKRFKVVDEYFNLLFKAEGEKKVPKLPKRFKRMKSTASVDDSNSTGSGRSRNPVADQQNVVNALHNKPELSIDVNTAQNTDANANISPLSSATSSAASSNPSSATSSPRVVVSPKQGGQKKQLLHKSLHKQQGSGQEVKSPTSASSQQTLDSASNSQSLSAASAGFEDHLVGAATGNITFTEFLRVNMRLAEDRILSFVCVFSTGYGTKWIPGATFFYQPEIQWNTLLTQRRRWLNGTFASFLFFFNSQRAQSRIRGGMFDSHKAGKNVRFVNALWSLQLFQMLLVFIAPAVFASACYIGLLDSGRQWPLGFGWGSIALTQRIIVADVWVGGFLGSYALWTLRSFNAPRGKMPESVCQFLAISGAVLIFPVYFAVWSSIFAPDGTFNVIDGLVIGALFLPIVIALAQSATSAFLYVLYLPWFMSLIIFFLVFVPSYSFARLWDTTWGNRATGKDAAINEKVENTMKFRNLVFIVFLIALNIGLTFGFIRMFRYNFAYVLAFMFIIFSPMIVQLVCSFFFLFIVMPFRNFAARSGNKDSDTDSQKHLSTSSTRKSRGVSHSSASSGSSSGSHYRSESDEEYSDMHYRHSSGNNNSGHHSQKRRQELTETHTNNNNAATESGSVRMRPPSGFPNPPAGNNKDKGEEKSPDVPQPQPPTTTVRNVAFTLPRESTDSTA